MNKHEYEENVMIAFLVHTASATQDGQNAEETIGTSVMKNSVLEACEDLCDEGCSSPTQDVLSILSNEIHDEGSAEKGQNGCATTVVTVDNIIDSKMNHHRPSDTASDDGYCIICYDATATCVFLECGHGGYCRKCANRLFVRPPHECPTCRQKIDQVGHRSHSTTILSLLINRHSLIPKQRCCL